MGENLEYEMVDGKLTNQILAMKLPFGQGFRQGFKQGSGKFLFRAQVVSGHGFRKG